MAYKTKKRKQQKLTPRFVEPLEEPPCPYGFEHLGWYSFQRDASFSNAMRSVRNEVLRDPTTKLFIEDWRNHHASLSLRSDVIEYPLYTAYTYVFMLKRLVRVLSPTELLLGQ